MMQKLMTFITAIALSIGPCFSQSSVWKINKNENTLYLGGSVHLLRAEDFPLPKEFDTAFDKSERLVLEADAEQMSNPAIAQGMMTQAMLAGDASLQTLLNEETYKLLEAKCGEFSIPMASVMKLKPGMLVNLLDAMKLQQLGFTPQGVDVYYLSKAKEKNATLDFLETIDFQINLLVNMGAGYENEFVLYSLENSDNLEKDINTLIPEWKNGTSKEVDTQTQEMKAKFPSVYKSMLTDRNNNWLPQIETYLNDAKVAFVIVGLAHLHGEDGLLAQLHTKGYAVKQVK
jgi:uncharacterized protein YbaP (TraB family)